MSLAQSVQLSLKRAADALDGYTQLAAQRYMPTGKRRELSPEEQDKLDAAKSRWLPTIFKSWGSPAEAGMYSPWTNAATFGLGGALAGGMAGSGLGNLAFEGEARGCPSGGHYRGTAWCHSHGRGRIPAGQAE